MDRIDEAVVIAMDARRRSYGRTTLGSKEAQDFEAMRAALLAGMKVLLGEPVAWMWERYERNCFDPAGNTGHWEVELCDQHPREVVMHPEDLDDPKRNRGIRALYAPSLGEGDGR